ncbi:MAG: hypothetical protein KGZ54_11285 [Dethiobacter sp.]|jgi:hypothetical protein|nr:hypothetical protein [Dethiobacter sp.]MBS3989532.1 hypothetical protein [Dethiobacter sp.]
MQIDNKKANVKIAVLMFVVLMLLPGIVLASSYHSTLSFLGEHRGPTRSYSGNNVGISMTAYTTTPQQPHHATTFTVELHRQNLIGSTYIGNSVFPRNGYKSNTWSSVGSGNYFYWFIKARDGVVVKSDNVHLFSN